jgi:hypothetical protein
MINFASPRTHASGATQEQYRILSIPVNIKDSTCQGTVEGRRGDKFILPTARSRSLTERKYADKLLKQFCKLVFHDHCAERSTDKYK